MPSSPGGRPVRKSRTHLHKAGFRPKALGLIMSLESIMVFFIFYYFYPNFVISNCLVATILSHRYNSRTGSGETNVESHASSNTQPNQHTSNPEASRTNAPEETPCTWPLRPARHRSRWCAMRQGHPYRPSPP